MADRIDKINRVDYERVEASVESQKDRSRDENQEDRDKDEFAKAKEKTDWKLLLDNAPQWKRNIQLAREEVEKIIFQKISLKTEPSLLRIDVVLKDGEIISPAFMAISRLVGLKIKNLNSGDLVPPHLLFHNHVLRITIPSNPDYLDQKRSSGTIQPAQAIQEKEPSPKETSYWQLFDPQTGRIKLEVSLIYGISGIVIILIIIGLSLLFNQT
ncbi:MAG: hypothetical protein A3G32_01495 [Deltaproteobacteria bacterium RIFCSPLOWO2_12_FULL_40_28]|nr:MAG: hypothetical protein A3C45_06240 [Deltaproteobacteria bacterium RIFCSPHIGHO2_02_FULL_40_28]OGQ18808.1 MAG: hypothetical protein A3E27_08875 [Deltaproteobacteria bacterium RIFCSPHIGHO2_12_FULL_40_32]OGQ40053.1 MAG: hypothetical protein A3I69_01405 [Deltaproteobacteria bacterium RIFCSPLOWO2_02_FULL_40_36]OGQ53236.1 MAG: hypothetical protein A3G32_01495 [Deltaproteobacteria bacterium RIFCSPLOWO2_12_FULL_40_28]